jgi:beta-N-acetylhexosaminidase
MVLVCNDRDAAVRVAQALQSYSDPVAHARLARMHGRSAVSWEQLHRDSRWRQVSAALSRYSDDGSLEFDFN